MRPIFETLAPAPDKGWGYVGPHGAGHYVKMVHNGIEYGMMQALAEGFNIMKAKQELAWTWLRSGDLALWERRALMAARLDSPGLESGPHPFGHPAMGGGFS